MKKNVGSTDKIVRMVLAIAIGYFAYSTVFETSWIQYVLYVIAGIMLVTPITGFCPLYTLFGVNTCEIKE
ncbi:DUF2892 domain-containing protein [Lutibacter sp.]|jgi:hypothetical protein|uniref:YgaP family membrane protein n=1 Tax=Lutibacter sp. TaxID=1925666 RepID=UPI001A326947|nr:DUF2892 domain-containing protein [Lutibacter sp.]MBI9040008.1 DUF2892 domain-containing protein [Lutibacter sp.]